jgi:response regulator RpfG family c-di-GMP phosphodiesterase
MRRTLLYIDPDPGVRLLVRKGLIPAGVTVLEAESTAQGSQLARHTSPDAVLIDVDLVGTDPAEVVRTLRQSPGLERAVLLASTAEDRPKRLEETVACGFKWVFVKPLDVDAVAAELRSHLPLVEAPPTPVPADWRQEGASHRWSSRLDLAPFIRNLMRTASVADGVLALLNSTGDAFVIVAADSFRPVGKLPEIGSCIPLNSAPWLHPVVRDRETVLVDPQVIGPSPLIPEGSTAVLGVPVATDERAYGVVVLGERRRRTFAFPPVQVSASLSEAGRIAAVLQEFDRLDDALRRTRREIDQVRLTAARTLLSASRPEPPEAAQARESLRRLSRGLSARLNLAPEAREVLERAVDAHDLGRTWIVRALLPYVTLPAEDRQGLVATHQEQTSEILRVLEWPLEVRQLVRPERVCPGGGEPDGVQHPQMALAAHILAVAAAYQALTTATESNGAVVSDLEALAELRRRSGSRFDPVVVEALTDLLSQNGPRGAHSSVD